MDDETYGRLARSLETVGLAADDLAALRATAEQRRDSRVEVLCALAVRDERRAAELTTAASAAAVGAIAAMVGRWKNADHAWHLLFHIAEVHPDALAEVEGAVADWRDDARLMPHRWWAQIHRGEYKPCHQLVRNVSLEGDAAHVLGLATARASLRRVTMLGLVAVDDRALATACDAGLDDVRLLEVRRSELAASSIADLIVGSSFPALRSLVLSGLRSSDELPAPRAFAEAIAENPLPLELVATALDGRSTKRPRFDLELKALGIDAIALRRFVREPALRGIATLTISFSVIGPDEIAIIASAENAVELTGISLHLGKIGPAGARVLFAAPFMPQLQVLRLSNQATTDVLGELMSRVNLGALEQLELTHNELGSVTAAALATADLGRLRSLDLSYNALSDDDLARVVANPRLRALDTLELLGTGAGERTARAIAAAPHLAALRTLNIGDAFGDDATAILAGAAALRGLRRLQLCGASDDAIAAIKTALDLSRAFVTNARFA